MTTSLIPTSDSHLPSSTPLTFCPKRFGRKIRSFCTKTWDIPCTVIAKIFARNIPLPRVPEEAWATDSNRFSILDRLRRRGTTLSSGILLRYLQKLPTPDLVHCDHFFMDHPFTTQSFADTSETVLPRDQALGIRLLAIPVILSSCCCLPFSCCNHIILILVDSDRNIHFFDSKGLSVLDHTSDHLKYPQVLFSNEGAERVETIPQLIQFLSKKYPSSNPSRTIYESTKKLQYDMHSCGLFVMEYIDLCLAAKTNGASFQTVHISPSDSGIRGSLTSHLRQKFLQYLSS